MPRGLGETLLNVLRGHDRKKFNRRADGHEKRLRDRGDLRRLLQLEEINPVRLPSMAVKWLPPA